jgi:hypothetical protein
MKQKLVMIGLLAGVLLSACNSLPPTTIVMVITATPDPRIIQITVTNTPEPQKVAATALPASATIQIPPTQPPNAAVTAGPVPGQPATPAPTVVQPSPGAVSTMVNTTPLPNVIPTDTRQQITIAQEEFQGGYMFWLEPTRDVWILLPAAPPKAGDAIAPPVSGEWRVYKDTFIDGEPETDPSLTAPGPNLYQPKRGFGKLWRNNPDIRAALGWATTPEFGLSTLYVYQPGGAVDQAGKWVPGPGNHFLISLGRQTFQFSEPQPGQTFGTWRKVG